MDDSSWKFINPYKISSGVAQHFLDALTRHGHMRFLWEVLQVDLWNKDFETRTRKRKGTNLVALARHMSLFYDINSTTSKYALMACAIFKLMYGSETLWPTFSLESLEAAALVTPVGNYLARFLSTAIDWNTAISCSRRSGGLEHFIQFADRESILYMLRQSGHSLRICPEALRNDPEIVMQAVQDSVHQHSRLVILQYASEELRDNRMIVIKAVKAFGPALQFASRRLQGDREIVEAAIRQDGSAFLYASPDLRADRELARVAVRGCGITLRAILPAFYCDREINLLAVQNEGYALEVLNDKFRNDPEVVLAAVGNYGLALQYASAELRNNKQVCLAAVSESPSAIEFVPPELRCDVDIVMTAVSQDGMQLQWASEVLRSTKSVVLAAVLQDSDALSLASDGLQADPEVLTAVKVGEFLKRISTSESECIS